MSDTNILSPLVDAIWDTGSLLFKVIERQLFNVDRDIPKFTEYELHKKNQLKIPIGKSVFGDLYIDLNESPNTFIVGTTGSGKSVCTKSILTSLVNMYTPKQLHLYLADLKRVELNLFADCEHTKQFCYKVEEVTKLIELMLEECEERYLLFMKHGVTNIVDYNKLPLTNLPYKVLFIEEIVLLLQDKKKVGMGLLKQLLSICRAGGVFVFITTQRPSADIICPVVKANIGNRIVFQVEDTNNSNICLDREGAELLEGKGHGLLKVGANVTEFKGYYISDEEVKRLVEPFRKKEPILTTSTPKGFIENKKDTAVDDLSFLDKL